MSTKKIRLFEERPSNKTGSEKDKIKKMLIETVRNLTQKRPNYCNNDPRKFQTGLRPVVCTYNSSVIMSYANKQTNELDVNKSDKKNPVRV